MDRVYHAMQSMTGALKGQPQTSMISHLVNVFFGYTQLEGRSGAEPSSVAKHRSSTRCTRDGKVWMTAANTRNSPVS